MATLENVHVMELDRATQKQVCTRVNPTRTFGMVTTYGTSFITWQNGLWFGAGGQEMRLEDVPEEYQARIAAEPVRVETDGPEVVVVCEFCGDKMNRSAKEQHLIVHVRDYMALAGTTRMPPPGDIIPPATTLPPRPGSRPGKADAA